MKARGAAVMGLLAASTLGVAYQTWQRPKVTKTDNTVVVLDASKTSLEKIHFEDGTRFIDLTRTVDGEPVVWLRQGFMEGKEPQRTAPDAGTADAGLLPDGGAAVASVPAPPPPPPTPIRDLRGNDRADKAWEKFAPFEAVRALGVLGEAKLKELSLDASPKLLEVTVARTARRFRVSNPGSGFVGQYVLDEKTREVYLLSAGAFTDIDPSASTLVERRLHAFKAPEYDSFVVKVDDKQKEFVQTDAQIPQTTKVAPKEAPDKPDEFVKNWHDKIWNRLIVTDVLGKGETPAQGEPQVLLRIDYLSKGKPKGWVEVARSARQSSEMFARSEQTAGWVSLHGGVEEMVLEAKKLVGGN